MKHIKLYEDLEFDPNNFRKLRKDIKAITIELIDNGFKVQPFEVENDNGFDNFDFYVKIYRKQTATSRWGFKVEEVEEYIETIKDYIDNYYTYSNLVVFYDGSKLEPKSTALYYANNQNITQVEIEIEDIKKK
jgi:hypothetical protein